VPKGGFKVKKLFIVMILCLSANALCFGAWDSKPEVKESKPLFFQGMVDSVSADGVNVTDSHQIKREFKVTASSEIFDTGGKQIALSDLHPEDRIKVMFHDDAPGNAVSVSRLRALTKEEKESYVKSQTSVASPGK
jgi:hypothetical protein